MERKIALSAFVLLIFLLVLLSSQTTSESYQLSRSLSTCIYGRLSGLIEHIKTSPEWALRVELNNFLRKTAHFLIFMLIALSLLFALKNNRIGKLRYILVFLIVFVLACGDELHQILVGRGSQFTDVIIEMCGVLFLFALIGIGWLLRKLSEAPKSAPKQQTLQQPPKNPDEK
jgi:VanZ family protein